MASNPANFTRQNQTRMWLGSAATDGAVTTNDVVAASGCVDASITVGAENANVRTVTIQLKNADGTDRAQVDYVQAALFLNSAMTAFATTGGSTGIEISTDGALLAVVAKKYWLLTSEADGDIDLTWTDTGTEPAFLGLILPSGRVIVSSALTNT